MTDDKKQKRVRVQNRQALIDTIVYLCPRYIDGGCVHYSGHRTNCTGRSTYSGGGACEHVKEFFETYCKFIRKELII